MRRPSTIACASAIAALHAASASANNAGPPNRDPSPRAAPAMVDVGPGNTDPSPRQLVRTRGDVLYIIAPNGTVYTGSPPSTTRLIAWKADRPGTPTRFMPMDNGHAPSGGVNTSASAIDGGDLIHSVWITPGKASYGIFNANTGLWQGLTTLENTGWTNYGQGDEGAAIAVSASGTPYAVWNYIDQNGLLRLHLAVSHAGVFGVPMQVDDIDVNGGARHPSVGFAPNGDFVVAWVDGDGGYSTPGIVRTRVLHANGLWDPSYAVPNETAGSSLDQSCSLLIGTDGTRHVTFLNTSNQIRYYYDTGSGWTGDQQPPYQITHDPVLGPDGAGGLYIYGHATPQPDLRGLGEGKQRFHKPAGATSWSPYNWIRDGYIDDASNARWSQFFDNHPEEVDFTWWNHNPVHTLQGDAAGYYIETGAQTVTAPILAGAIDLQLNPDTSAAGTAEAFPFVAQQSGPAARIGAYVDVTNNAARIVLGLYSDAGGQPGTLLAQGILSGKTASIGQWHEAAIKAAPQIVAGRTYWIAVLAPAGQGAVGFRDTASGGIGVTSAANNLAGLPKAWTSGTQFSNAPLAAYVVGP